MKTGDHATDEPVAMQAPYPRALRAIRDLIERGHVLKGEILPSERTLSEQIRVSRPTVHAALRELANARLVAPREKRGWIVTAEVNAVQPLSQTVGVLTRYTNTEAVVHMKSPGSCLYVVNGITEAIGASGLHTLILQPDKLVNDMPVLLNAGLRGVIATYDMCEMPAVRQVLDNLISRSVTVVGHAEGLVLDNMDTVSSDHADGAARIVRWLFGKGKRNILRVWHRAADSRRPAWLAQRDAGYERGCGECGLTALPALEIPVHLPEAMYYTQDGFIAQSRVIAGYLAEAFVKNPQIDAVMAIADPESFPVSSALRMMGKIPNRDLLVAGYDNFWSDSFYAQWEDSPPAVTVDKKNFDTGRAMVALLQDRMNGQLPGARQHRLVKPELVIVKE